MAPGRAIDYSGYVWQKHNRITDSGDYRRRMRTWYFDLLRLSKSLSKNTEVETTLFLASERPTTENGSLLWFSFTIQKWKLHLYMQTLPKLHFLEKLLMKCKHKASANF